VTEAVAAIRLSTGGWKVAEYVWAIDGTTSRHARGSITNAIGQGVVVINGDGTLSLTELGIELAQHMGWTPRRTP
jgi:hypothetical protein